MDRQDKGDNVCIWEGSRDREYVTFSGGLFEEKVESNVMDGWVDWM
jgi:antibiotic biosynthesis monooxygenase (ABM) superfamily enzyme